MDEPDYPRLIPPRTVAAILRRNIQKLRELRRVDPTFPKPVKIGRKHMFVESEFLAWMGETLKNRRVEL